MNIPREAEKPDESEIEITPEMIEAGIRAYYRIDKRVADLEFILEETFRAMVRATHVKHKENTMAKKPKKSGKGGCK